MKNKAFTFVELIVVVTILAILALIGTVSYTGYIGDSRDAKRQANLSEIKGALKLYKQNRGSYPLPSDRFNISYNSDIVAYQGKMGSGVSLSNVDSLPLDPKLNLPYTYSVSKNRTEFQLSASLENSGVPKAIVLGDYKSVSKDTLPSISIATSTGINIASDKNKFIFDNQSFNLPYTFSSPYSPLSASGATFSGVLNDAIAKNTFWQNSDFRSCEEIEESGKLLNSSGLGINYQVIDNNGSTQNVSCNPYDACSSAGQVLQATSTYPGCDTKDIIVCSGVDTGLTLAACNIGATIAGTDHNNPATVGNFFQWGNNFGFVNPITNSGTTLANTSGFGPGNYYSSGTFIKASSTDWENSPNSNLWGAVTNTNEAKKGPCAEGYRLPNSGSSGEWGNVITAGSWQYNKTDFKNKIKIPESGVLWHTSGSIWGQGTCGVYYGNNNIALSFSSQVWPQAWCTNFYKAYGANIRCFKN